MKDTTHLHYLSSVILAPTSGARTIAQAGEAFGYIDPDFKVWGTDIVDNDTKETPLDIYEMSKGGNYRTLLGSISSNFSALCLTQGQIIELSRNHRNLLRQDSCTTLFLFRSNRKIFIAVIFASDEPLQVVPEHFSRGRVWSAECRFKVVVPQREI